MDQVVLGTRSAVFAPLENLGLIVMDEEQEAFERGEDTVSASGENRKPAGRTPPAQDTD